MKAILTWQGSVMIGTVQIPVAGYSINEDLNQATTVLETALQQYAMDSASNSPISGSPDVRLQIAVEPLPSPSTNSGNSGNAGNSPSPTMTASQKGSPPSGTSSPASDGMRSAGARPVR